MSVFSRVLNFLDVTNKSSATTTPRADVVHRLSNITKHDRKLPNSRSKAFEKNAGGWSVDDAMNNGVSSISYGLPVAVASVSAVLGTALILTSNWVAAPQPQQINTSTMSPENKAMVTDLDGNTISVEAAQSLVNTLEEIQSSDLDLSSINEGGVASDDKKTSIDSIVTLKYLSETLNDNGAEIDLLPQQELYGGIAKMMPNELTSAAWTKQNANGSSGAADFEAVLDSLKTDIENSLPVETSNVQQEPTEKSADSFKDRLGDFILSMQLQGNSRT